jgi:hypothetical protein
MAMDQLKWIRELPPAPTLRKQAADRAAFFAIFFAGMSMPMSAALVSHLVGYNMTWSSTVKTVEKSNFFLQIPIIWKRFYPQLVFFGLCVVCRIVSSWAGRCS